VKTLKINKNNHFKTFKEMKIKPLADRVVVQPQEAETKTASGLYIPDTAKEKPQRGKIVAVGSGKKDEPMELKEGDMVLYGKYAGTEINVDNEEYLIMRQSDVLAII
jgi:chaperonin GroES